MEWSILVGSRETEFARQKKLEVEKSKWEDEKLEFETKTIELEQQVKQLIKLEIILKNGAI